MTAKDALLKKSSILIGTAREHILSAFNPILRFNVTKIEAAKNTEIETSTKEVTVIECVENTDVLKTEKQIKLTEKDYNGLRKDCQ